MPRLPSDLRERAIGMLHAGMTSEEVAQTMGCSSRSIRRLRERFRLTGRTADRPRTGRPRVTTRAQDRYIVVSHLRDRFLTASQTAHNTPGRHNNRISSQTVRNRLRESGLRAYRPFVAQVLTRQHRQARLAWARHHLRWTSQQWKNVLFSDESRFCLTRPDGRCRVYRRRNERCAQACVQERDRFGGGASVMVWGGISHDHRTALVIIHGGLNATRYRDEILQPHVLPYANAHPETILQQDNATCHSARLTQNFLQTSGVEVLPFPAKSPDLNPIEHAWDALDRRIRHRDPPPRNVQELTDALLEEWTNIPQEDLKKLVKSMRRRCQAVIDAQGGHTRY